MNQWVGLGISYLFIFGLIGAAQGLLRGGVLGASGTRKVVHIGVAHWWILAMIFFESPLVALIGPVSFVAINWWSWRTHLFAAMEHQEHRRNLGTIWFPVSLTVLVLLTFTGLFPRWYGLVAILVLGWGDGLASVVGERLGGREGAIRFRVPGGRKSVAGTAAGFLAAGIVTTVVTTIFVRSGVPASLGGGGGGGGTGGGGGALARGVQLLRETASATWLGQPTENIALVALSRLDGIVQVVAQRAVSELGMGAGGALFTTLTPTTILAIGLIIAAVATVVELMTPWGLDNITVPLTVFVVLAALMTLPPVWIVRLAWALGLNIFVAVVAYLRSSVTATGAIAGAALGLLIFLSGGGFFWSVLMAFFFSSSILSRVKGRGKSAAERIHAKGGRRDAVQVLANGGLAALMAVAYALTAAPVFLLGFGIALAAANADTWASEIGVLSRRDPVSILTMRPVPRGTSGGISPLGLLASAAGALFIAVWFALGYWFAWGWNSMELWAVVAAITGGGFLGSLVDSVLGATVQAQYWDGTREAATERPADAGGRPNRLTRGLRGINNDAVNALSGLISTVVLVLLVTS